MRCASSIGTTFGYPDPVNPLIPIWSPERIKAAASPALIIFRSRLGFRTRVLVGAAIDMESLSCSMWGQPLSAVRHLKRSGAYLTGL
jgi:hypothetical protein